MPTLGQILPSLASLGLWSYWIIGLAALLEAFFATGIIIPGTLIVDAGGILVQRGVLDFFDLAWFVAVGSVLGGEISYWTGILARRGLNRRWNPENSPSYRKAEALFHRYGGLALVFGRFAGPVSGLVPFAASVAGMPRRKFVIWNLISGLPYALAHVALGYFLGGVITRLGPMATRAALFAGAVLVLLAILWWLVIRLKRMLPFVLSVLRSVAQAIADNPGVQSWSLRHPRAAGLIGSRLDSSRFAGLTATLLAAVFGYFLFVWVGTVLDLLLAEPIIQADTRLANLVHAFWNPTLLRVFVHVTAFGDLGVVSALMAAAVLWLLVRRRVDMVLGLCVAVLGDIVSVTALKAIFHRPRPDLAYLVETSGSFPSGHAAISVAFYGMIFFIAWRLGRLGPLAAALLAATLAFAIGLSRIYLIEHYLTDVLNGWLVGGMWLVIGIAAAEWWHEAHPSPTATPSPPSRRLRLASNGAILALIGAVGWMAATYGGPRTATVQPPGPVVVASAAAAFLTENAPVNTESVTGTPLEPLNLLILARDRASLIQAMQKAGWTRADRPSVSSLARAVWAKISGSSYAVAPVTPYFWDRLPNDLAFEKPTADQNLQKRHHARFWQSRFVTVDGLRLFVAAASFDDGLDWTLLHHIDPNIDAERDVLAGDLMAAGVASSQGSALISTPSLGQSVAGDPWFTDGKALVLTVQ